MRSLASVALVLTTVFSAAAAQTATAPAAPTSQAVSSKAQQHLDVIKAVSPSLVQVQYTLQYDKGEPPRSSGVGQRCPNCGQYHGLGVESYVSEERPMEMPGFLLADNTVITPDVSIHPRFVKQIAVRFGDKAEPASISAYAKNHRAALLKISKPLPGAKPLAFDAAAKGSLLAVSYQESSGQWLTHVSPLSLKLTTSDWGRKFYAVDNDVLIVTDSGVPVGMTMNNKLTIDDSWKGSPANWPSVSAQEMAGMLADVQQKCDRCVMRVTLNFRSPRKGASDPYRYRSSNEADSATEQHVSGVLLEPSRLLVLAELKPNITARLEKITVHGPDKQVSGKFDCTLSDWGGFIVKLDEPMNGAASICKDSLKDMDDRLVIGAEVILQGEKRVTYFQHRRQSGARTGWRNMLFPDIAGGEENLFTFDSAGNLMAFPISRRQKAQSDRYSYDSRGGGLTPCTHVQAAIAGLPGSADLSNVPLTQEQEARLAWIGVILQPLNPELARANNVSDMTSDGTTGALVAFVYPDSPAAKQQVKAGDILLRLQAPDQPKPLEVQAEDDRYSGRSFPWERLDSLPEEYYERVPAPWPPAETQFTRMITDLGFGKKFTAEFFVGGQLIKKEFEVVEGPPHYESAARYKSEDLGMTVRDLTYEVRRHLQKQATDPGVVISSIEPGSRASLAGIKPFELVTHVNGQQVGNVKEFQKLVDSSKALRLSIQRMNKGRQVQISLDQPASKPATRKSATLPAEDEED